MKTFTNQHISAIQMWMLICLLAIVGMSAQATPTYNAPAATTDGVVYASYIRVGGTIFTATSNTGAAYAHNTSTAFTLVRGAQMPYSVNFGYSGTAVNAYWNVWVDLNQDGVFASDEYMVQNRKLAAQVSPERISIPESAMLGDTRMRVMCYKHIPFDTTAQLLTTDPEFGGALNGQIIDFDVKVEAQGAYCYANGGYSDRAHVKTFSITGSPINNVSNNNGGYADFTSQVAKVQVGATHQMKITAGLATGYTTMQQSQRAWIDFNNNGIFETTERVISATTTGVSAKSYNVLIPVTTTNGTVRMRVAVSISNTTPTEACGGQLFGEYEDYTLDIQGQASSYCVPTVGSATSQWIWTFGSAGMNVGTGSNGYYNSANHYNKPMFKYNPNQSYTFKLRLKGLSGQTAVANNVAIFIDANGDGDFEDAGEMVYTNYHASMLAERNATLTVPQTGFSGLTRMRIQLLINQSEAIAPCAEVVKGEVEDWMIYINPVAGSRDESVEAHDFSGADAASAIATSVYPNPATDVFNISIDEPNFDVATIVVTDLSGREMVRNENVQLSYGLSVPVSTTDWAAGTYIAVVQSGSKMSTEKIIVSK